MSTPTPPPYRAGRRTALAWAAGLLAVVAGVGAFVPAGGISAANPPGAGGGGGVDLDPDSLIPYWATALPANTTQVLRTVASVDWCEQVLCARTEAWEKLDGIWQLAPGPGIGGLAVFRSQIGSRGFAAPGQRRANDLRTPTGTYRISVAFSTGATRPTDLPWRRRLPTSEVSSAAGPTYNTWIERPENTAGARRMMSWGLWLDYNNPRLEIGVGPEPVPGLGSGIFVHTSNPGAPWAATLACVQIGDPAAMEWVVRWLRPAANPRVLNNI